MKRKRVRTLCLTAMLSLATLVAAVGGPSPDNPTLTEKRFQASQLAAFFAVIDFARQWVRRCGSWRLTPGEGNRRSCLMHYPITACSVPNLPWSVNVAPASVIHFWFVLQGPAEVVPVPGAG
jgi:hypothetical protein